MLSPCKRLLKRWLANVHAMSHITGGGLTDNLPRVLPDTLSAQIEVQSWQMPAVFEWLQDNGNIEQKEMYRTFNCGVGFVVIVPADMADKAVTTLQDAGETAWQLGQIVKRNNSGNDTSNNNEIAMQWCTFDDSSKYYDAPSSLPQPMKVAVLVSGSGSNLQVLIDAVNAGKLPIEIVGVMSNKEDAYALTVQKRQASRLACFHTFRMVSRLNLMKAHLSKTTP